MAGCCLIRAVGVLAAALALTAHAAEVKLLADGVTVLDGVRYAPVGEAETALGSQAGRAKCRQLTKALREAAEARDPATAGFVPALLMPVPLQPKAASVPSVAVSLRRAGRDAYLIAAHSGAAEVTAELDVFDEGVAAVDVLWENRTLAIAGTTLRDTFAPGATHVYHWRMPDVEYVGHQGEEGLAPNHSHPAYDLSVRHGLERIKLDLHETKDGEIVLQHDGTLKAVMGWDVRIRDLTLAEIREKGRSRPRGGYTNETIVTLAEALAYGRRAKKGVWLDFKEFSPALADKAFAQCREAGLGADKIMVATFNKSALAYAKERYPDVARVAHTFIRRNPAGGFETNSGRRGAVYANEDELVAELLRHRDELGLTGFNIPHVVSRGRLLYHSTENVVRALRKAGCWVSIWFVNDPYTGELYRGYGASNFVTAWKGRTERAFLLDPRSAHEHSLKIVDFGLGWNADPPPARPEFDIRRYGARENALPADNARAIQSAIDAAAERGGRVVVPKGTWPSGTLWLKTGVELHLKKDAVLKASEDMADYNAEDAYPENWGSKREEWVGKHLIIAREATDVSLTGPGTVDGSSGVFFEDRPDFKEGRVTWQKGHRKAKDKALGRPGQMVVFVKCRKVFVGDGLTLRNSPCWTLFLWGCRDVTVRDCVVRNRPTDGNTDGIDIDCCDNVLVERADIRTGDDGITVRTAGQRLYGGATRPVCQNVVIRDCTIESEAMGLRFGVGEGVIRNVTVEDVRVAHAGYGVAFYMWYGWTKEMEARQGVDMENIVFRRLKTEDCYADVKLNGGGKKLTFGFRKVSFADSAFGGCLPEERQITSDAPVEDIVYENCRRQTSSDNSYRNHLKAK